MSECTNNPELESLRQERDQLRAELAAERDKVYGLECGQLTRMERERDAARACVAELEHQIDRLRDIADTKDIACEQAQGRVAVLEGLLRESSCYLNHLDPETSISGIGWRIDAALAGGEVGK